MGAASFDTAAFGKTPQAAFNAAQDNARYERGHGGYTGTIAEKYGFEQVTLPKGVTLPTFLKLMHEAEEFQYSEYMAERLRNHKEMGCRRSQGVGRQDAQAGAGRVRQAEAQGRSLLDSGRQDAGAD